MKTDTEGFVLLISMIEKVEALLDTTPKHIDLKASESQLQEVFSDIQGSALMH